MDHIKWLNDLTLSHLCDCLKLFLSALCICHMSWSFLWSIIWVEMWLFVGWYWPSLFKLSFIFLWQSIVFWVESNIFRYCLQLSLTTEDLYVKPDKLINPHPHCSVLVSINHVKTDNRVQPLTVSSWPLNIALN